MRFVNNITDKFNVIIPPQDIACDPGCLRRLASGDRDAYQWLYKNYCKKVYDYALLITANETVSEDIVQETFLKVWLHREKLAGVENFNNYLFILYRNHIMDVLKRQVKEAAVRNKYHADTAFEVVRPDEKLLYKEQRHLLDRAINKLSVQRKIVYKLSREEGLKRKAIAQQLNISPFTVQNHMQHALRFLKGKLSEY